MIGRGRKIERGYKRRPEKRMLNPVGKMVNLTGEKLDMLLAIQRMTVIEGKCGLWLEYAYNRNVEECLVVVTSVFAHLDWPVGKVVRNTDPRIPDAIDIHGPQG